MELRVISVSSLSYFYIYITMARRVLLTVQWGVNENETKNIVIVSPKVYFRLQPPFEKVIVAMCSHTRAKYIFMGPFLQLLLLRFFSSCFSSSRCLNLPPPWPANEPFSRVKLFRYLYSLKKFKNTSIMMLKNENAFTVFKRKN